MHLEEPLYKTLSQYNNLSPNSTDQEIFKHWDQIMTDVMMLAYQYLN
jgi:hypothetical protein